MNNSGIRARLMSKLMENKENKKANIALEVLYRTTLDAQLKYLIDNHISLEEYNDSKEYISSKYKVNDIIYVELETVSDKYDNYLRNIKDKSNIVNSPVNNPFNNYRKGINLLEDIMISGLYSREYCIVNKLSYTTYLGLLDSVKQINRKRYEEYKTYSRVAKKAFYANLKEIATIMAIKINDGIYDGKELFDIFDYYTYTNFSFEDFLTMTHDVLDGKDYITIKKFVTRNSNSLRLLPEESLLHNFYSYKGIVPSTEEKQAVLDYMVNNKYPMYDAIFYSILKRTIKGTLTIDKPYILKK